MMRFLITAGLAIGLLGLFTTQPLAQEPIKPVHIKVYKAPG